jgi:hypothetical protein
MGHFRVEYRRAFSRPAAAGAQRTGKFNSRPSLFLLPIGRLRALSERSGSKRSFFAGFSHHHVWCVKKELVGGLSSSSFSRPYSCHPPRPDPSFHGPWDRSPSTQLVISDCGRKCSKYHANSSAIANERESPGPAVSPASIIRVHSRGFAAFFLAPAPFGKITVGCNRKVRNPAHTRAERRRALPASPLLSRRGGRGSVLPGAPA